MVYSSQGKKPTLSPCSAVRHVPHDGCQVKGSFITVTSKSAHGFRDSLTRNHLTRPNMLPEVLRNIGWKLPIPIPSMYGLLTYIYLKNQPNVGRYTIHGMVWDMISKSRVVVCFLFQRLLWCEMWSYGHHFRILCEAFCVASFFGGDARKV